MKIQQKVIQIIDDSKFDHALIKPILMDEGYKVISSHDAEQAFDMIEIYPPDLILLDRRLPDMHGNEILERLKLDDDLKTIPVIMITGDSDVKDMASSLTLGAMDYVVKPIVPYDLLMRVKKVFDSGQRFWHKRKAGVN